MIMTVFPWMCKPYISNMKFVIGLASLFLLFNTFVCSDVSFTKPLFSTKTPYFWVQNATEAIPENQYSTTNYDGHICQIKGLNIVFRHGARFPTLRWIQRMTNLHIRLKSNVAVISKHPFIKQWSNPYPDDEAALLSSLGKEEMLKLGERFSNRFKMALEGQLEHINFAVTHKSRTQTSYRYFYHGLNHTFPSDTQRPVPKVDNGRLRFYDSCSLFNKGVKDNDKTHTVSHDFLNGQEMTNVTEKVREKLGFSNLTLDEVLVIQQYCAMELGMYNHSNWCNFFDMDDLKVIDYLNDIEKYYEWGYGYPINWQQSCPFTSHVFKTFDHFIQTSKQQNNKTPPPIDISFGHAETLFPVYTALGLFNDSKPFLSSDYKDNTHRKFHGSNIVPFSANLAIGLYRCDNSSEFVIKIFVNEKTVEIPACGQTVCSYTDARKYYNNLVDCNFDKLCDINNIQSIFG